MWLTYVDEHTIIARALTLTSGLFLSLSLRSRAVTRVLLQRDDRSDISGRSSGLMILSAFVTRKGIAMNHSSSSRGTPTNSPGNRKIKEIFAHMHIHTHTRRHMAFSCIAFLKSIFEMTVYAVDAFYANRSVLSRECVTVFLNECARCRTRESLNICAPVVWYYNFSEIYQKRLARISTKLNSLTSQCEYIKNTYRVECF